MNASSTPPTHASSTRMAEPPRTTVECTPADRVTKSLLGYGIVAGPCYVVVSLAQALTRHGFDLGRHEWSLLANGDNGWIQVANLIVTGLMVIAFAIGLRRALTRAPAPAGPRDSSVSMARAWSPPDSSALTRHWASRSALRKDRGPCPGTVCCTSPPEASASAASRSPAG